MHHFQIIKVMKTVLCLKSCFGKRHTKWFEKTHDWERNSLRLGAELANYHYFAIGTNNLIVAMDPTEASLRLGKDFAEKNNINNVVS